MSWFTTFDNSRLWFEDSGTGTPLVLIHGWCMSSAIWGLQRESLAKTFRVITLDLRGHGSSPAHPDGFQSRKCAEDIAALLEYLSISDAMVVGWSLGAQIAIETYLLCKELCSALVLLSATPRFVQSDNFPFGLTQLEVEGMARKVQRSLRRALEGFTSRMFAPEETVSETVHTILSSVPLPSEEVALQALGALVNTDLCSSLALIDCPTLIIHGDRDRICLPQASEFMSVRIPLSHRRIFPGCGHAPFLTRSTAFNSCIEDFRLSVTGGFYRPA
jgi:pimeloyl-[acyl-carrier protein] methyl ester esterase